MNFKNYKVIIAFILINFNIFCQTDLKTLEILYKKSNNIEDKLAISKKLLENPSKDMENLVVGILNDQAVYSVPNNKDQALYNEWVYITVLLVMNADIKNGAIQLKKIFDKVTDFAYKSEILLVIGKIGNKDLLPWLNNLLYIANNSNREGRKDFPDGYIYNLVDSIGYFNDTSSFKYLFYVANPGYATKIRKRAQEILSKMTNDPAPLCAEYMKDESNQTMILNALYYAINSNSPNENKILACKTALSLSMTTSSSDTQQSIQNEIRNEAAVNLGNYKAGGKDVVDLLVKKWSFDRDINSRLTTIQALQNINSEDSCRALVDFLNFFIDKTNRGAKLGFTEQEGNKLFVALIRAIGSISNAIGVEELTFLSLSPNYGDIIKREANSALKKKPKQ
jgi:hypothetical protein